MRVEGLPSQLEEKQYDIGNEDLDNEVARWAPGHLDIILQGCSPPLDQHLRRWMMCGSSGGCRKWRCWALDCWDNASEKHCQSQIWVQQMIRLLEEQQVTQ